MKRIATKRVPEPRPSEEQLHQAFNVLRAYHLHFYQLLYFAEPSLTSPGHGYPFNLKPSPTHTNCIQVECFVNGKDRPEFNFLITSDMSDEVVLTRCQVILAAIAANKTKISAAACCPLAEHTNCVCAESFSCVIHGEKHIGTHD